MGNRFHNNRYPSYAKKSIFGRMPKWLKRFQHRLMRQRTREALNRGDEDIPPIPKGRIQNMWY